MTNLNCIISFVEGKLSPAQFQEEVYTNTTLEKILSENTDNLFPYTNGKDIYTYIIEKNFNNIGDLYDIHEVLSNFLKIKNIQFNKNSVYKNLFNNVLNIIPNYVGMPLDFIFENLNAQYIHGDINKLKLFIKESFKYIKNKPKWLQAPQWPIDNKKPLLFVAQIDISILRHDTSQLYIFYNSDKDIFYIIEQSL